MSASDDNSFESIAWPGFVDILSSVIIIFVFFVMIVVVVLFLYAREFTAKEAERLKKELKDQSVVSQEVKDTREKITKEIENLEVQKQELEKDVSQLLDKIQQTAKGFGKSEDISFKKTDTEFIVFFDTKTAILPDEITLELEQFLTKNPVGKSLIIEVPDENRSDRLSNTREFNLTRMMNVRNIMLSGGYQKDQVDLKFVPYEQIDDKTNWLRVRLK